VEQQIRQRESELAVLRDQLQLLQHELVGLGGPPQKSPPAGETGRLSLSPLLSPLISAVKPGAGVSWQDYIKDRSKFDRRGLHSLILQAGVPLEMRHEVWPLCVRVHKYNFGLYDALLKTPSNAASANFVKQIDQDILRTLPDHSAFSAPTASGVAPLKRILLAYTRRNPSIGYCQGLGLIAAGFLVNMEEEQAYWTFCATVENFLPQDYYTPGMMSIMADQLVLGELLQQHVPQLKQHFDKCMFDLSIVSFNWFMTLFMDAFPLEVCFLSLSLSIPPPPLIYFSFPLSQTTFRIWDVLFCQGIKALFGVSLAILDTLQQDLLNIRNAGELCMKFKALTHTIYQSGPLLERSLDFTKSLSNRSLRDQSLAHLQRLRSKSPRTIGTK